jgi:hypothetical protein
MSDTTPPIPPDGYELFTGEYLWNPLPKGSLVWVGSSSSWIELVYETCAIPPGFYAIPKLRLPDVPKDPAPHLTILEEAQDLVNGDRQQAYGDAYESFDRIAKMWSAYKGIKITPKDVASMMILMKVSRSVTSSKRDNWVDIAGYAELGSQIEAREAAPE